MLYLRMCVAAELRAPLLAAVGASRPAPAARQLNILALQRLVRRSTVATLPNMELPVALVLVLVLPTTTAETLNSRWPNLLPQDCGRRLSLPGDTYRQRIVGDGTISTTSLFGQFP